MSESSPLESTGHSPRAPASRLRLVPFVCALVLSGAAAGCRPSAFDDPRHILLVTVDTQRQDHWGTYGFPEPTSPRIDAIAAEGIVFENAVTVAGTTFPAHGSMLTGLYPREHGAVANGFQLSEGIPTAAELLTEAGFRTGSFVSYPGMHKNGDLDRGFQAASDRTAPGRGIRSGDETVRSALGWLDGVREEPDPRVFLWVHLFEPHTPYEVTEWSRARLEGYDGVLSEGAPNDLLAERKEEILASPEDLRALRALYSGGVREGDRLVGELIDGFRERLGDDFALLLLSDHGEGLGEGGQLGHGQVFWESVLRVPLVLWTPREAAPRRVAHRVSVLDVAATLFDLAGLDVPSLHGLSLLETAQAEEPIDRVLYAETAADNPRRVAAKIDYEPTDRNSVAVFSGRYKFERLVDEERLYEQGDDLRYVRVPPAEIVNSVWRELSERADEFTSEAGLAVPARLDEEDLEQLRALGYLN